MLVGRGTELAALADSLDQGAIVAGEAGIGKTTLLRTAAARTGLEVFEGLGLASLSWLSYLPIARALGREPPVGDDAAVAADCAEQVGDGVLVIDDLQWADSDTAALLPLLAGRIRLLAALRRGDPAAPRRLEEAQAAGMTVIEIGSLSRESAATLVRARHPGFTDADVDAVVGNAGGNPFLLEELSDSPAGSDTLRLSFEARLARLSGLGRETIARLALLARPAPPDLAGPGADEGLESGLVSARPDGALALRHALIGEAAAAALDEDARRALHGELAGAVGDAGEAARHHVAAGEREAAYATALKSAGESRYESEQARHLALAAACAPAAEADELRLRAGLALARTHQPLEALELADLVSAGEPVTAARAAEVKAVARLRLGDTQGEIEADLGLALAAGADAGLEARLLLAKASYRSVDWDGPGTLELAERALTLLRSAGEPESPALMMQALGAHTALDERCLRYYASAVEEARAEGDTTGELEACLRYASALFDFGRGDEAELLARSLESRAASLGHRGIELNSRLVLGAVAYNLRADCARTIALARAALEERAAFGETAAILEGVLALALADTGEEGAALDVLRPALDQEPTLAGQGTLMWSLGETHWRAQRPLEALRAAARGVTLDSPYAPLCELTAIWARRDGAQLNLSAPAWESRGDLAIRKAIVAERRAHAEGSAETFDRAATAWERTWLSASLRCRWAAAEAALAAGHIGDGRRRLLELEARLSELRLLPLLGRVRRSLRRAGVRRSAPRRPAGGALTAREREVLGLVGKGLTSAEVGARLGIAPATVDSQVKSAMRKLGARTRRQAATAVSAD